MFDTRYPFISAYLKGEEAKTITFDHINRMSMASDIQDALGAIRQTDIGSYFEELHARNFDVLDEHLWRYFAQRINYIGSFKLLPGDILKVLSAYIVKYDVLNIKAALQNISTGKKSRMIPIGIIHNNGLLDKLSTAPDLDNITEILTRCKLGNYMPALEGYATAGETKSKFLAEAKLDSEYYKNLLETARGIKDGPTLSKAITLLIDMANLQVVSRAIIEGIGLDAAGYTIPGGYMITDKAIRELLSCKLTEMPQRLESAQYRRVAEEILNSYSKTNSITVVDRIIDKHKLRLLREILSPRTLSPLVMAWYLILKEFEIRNLRLILKAIADGISPEEIKEYLVL